MIHVFTGVHPNIINFTGTCIILNLSIFDKVIYRCDPISYLILQVIHSSSSLHVYLRSISKDLTKMTHFGEVLLQIFKDYQKVDRCVFNIIEVSVYGLRPFITLLYRPNIMSQYMHIYVCVCVCVYIIHVKHRNNYFLCQNNFILFLISTFT